MKTLFHPPVIIGIGCIFFIVAYIAHLKSGGPIYHWFEKMHWIGRVAVIGFCCTLAWLVISQFVKRR